MNYTLTGFDFYFMATFLKKRKNNSIKLTLLEVLSVYKIQTKVLFK